MHGYLDKKCFGIIMIIAGVLLGAIAYGVWYPKLNLTLFFAIMAVLIGIHSLACKCDAGCCEPAQSKSKK